MNKHLFHSCSPIVFVITFILSKGEFGKRRMILCTSSNSKGSCQPCSLIISFITHDEFNRVITILTINCTYRRLKHCFLFASVTCHAVKAPWIRIPIFWSKKSPFGWAARLARVLKSGFWHKPVRDGELATGQVSRFFWYTQWRWVHYTPIRHG